MSLPPAPRMGDPIVPVTAPSPGAPHHSTCIVPSRLPGRPFQYSLSKDPFPLVGGNYPHGRSGPRKRSIRPSCDVPWQGINRASSPGLLTHLQCSCPTKTTLIPGCMPSAAASPTRAATLVLSTQSSSSHGRAHPRPHLRHSPPGAPHPVRNVCAPTWAMISAQRWGPALRRHRAPRKEARTYRPVALVAGGLSSCIHMRSP
ncbi:hypothetical protein BC834DRAFT_147088 [Gloeopeniophorella convolvens]|nr:hypothetical protein BC834DRAFT_147088 [Gloeopeniophorella convolvens]